MRIRVAQWSELGGVDPEPTRYSTDKCPVCGGKMWLLSHNFFCPDEDAHRGGVLVTIDGIARRADGGTIPPPISPT
jgi:hypothetical protein